MLELVIIGERFYKESQSSMSAIYKVLSKGRYERYDWGFLQLDMMAGREIHIRQASKEELKFFESKLNENLVKLGFQKGQSCRIFNQEDFFDFILPEIGEPLVMGNTTTPLGMVGTRDAQGIRRGGLGRPDNEDK